MYAALRCVAYYLLLLLRQQVSLERRRIQTGSPRSLNILHLVHRRTLVVLLAPDEVPDGRGDEEGEEDDRGVVHELSGRRNGRGHAEKRDGKGGPS